MNNKAGGDSCLRKLGWNQENINVKWDNLQWLRWLADTRKVDHWSSTIRRCLTILHRDHGTDPRPSFWLVIQTKHVVTAMLGMKNMKSMLVNKDPGQCHDDGDQVLCPSSAVLSGFLCYRFQQEKSWRAVNMINEGPEVTSYCCLLTQDIFKYYYPR